MPSWVFLPCPAWVVLLPSPTATDVPLPVIAVQAGLQSSRRRRCTGPDGDRTVPFTPRRGLPGPPPGGGMCALAPGSSARVTPGRSARLHPFAGSRSTPRTVTARALLAPLPNRVPHRGGDPMRPVQTMLLLAALLLSSTVRAEEPEGGG